MTTEHHAAESAPIPKTGWVCLSVDDYGKKSEATCGACGTSIRYVHRLYHEDEAIAVNAGRVCAGRLTGDPTEARRKEAAARKKVTAPAPTPPVVSLPQPVVSLPQPVVKTALYWHERPNSDWFCPSTHIGCRYLYATVKRFGEHWSVKAAVGGGKSVVLTSRFDDPLAARLHFESLVSKSVSQTAARN